MIMMINLEYIISRAGQVLLVPVLVLILIEIIRIRNLLEEKS